MEKKKLKRYRICKDSETYAISLVDEPAIEVDWVYLSKQKPMVFKNDEKHMVVGPVLIPDKPIYRVYENEEFEVVFESDVIEKMAYEFMTKERTNSITLDHMDDANNISVVESWIKMSENDKSNDFGFDCPIGTWFACMKINDDETWEKIKNGELNGFSVESLVSLEEYNFNKIIKKEENFMISEMFDEESLLTKIKAIINDALGKSEDEPQDEVVEDAAIEVVEEAKEELVETPTEEVVEAEVEDTVVDVPVDEPMVEEVVDEVVAVVEEEAVTEEEEKVDLQAIIDGLNEQINALNAQVEELKQENQKLSKQPSAKPVNVHNGTSGWDMLREIRNSHYGK